MERSIFLSLGQLVNPVQSKTINAFVELIVHDHPEYFHFQATALTYLALTRDYLWYGNIAAYNRGDISTEEFRTRVSAQLDVREEDFDNAWNAMCDFDEQTAENIVSFFQALDPTDYVYIMSNTNPLQYDFSVNRINALLEHNELSMENARFTLSFQEHELSHRVLALNAIRSHGLDHIGYNIISLHRGIDELYLHNAEFERQEFAEFIAPLAQECDFF